MPNRFEVGSGTNWSDDLLTWSTSSAGLPGTAHPTVSDIAIFDVNSPGCVIDIDATCNRLNCTGFEGSVTGSNKLTIGGSVITANVIDGDWSSYTGTLTYTHTVTKGNNFANGLFGGSVEVNTATGTVNIDTTSVAFLGSITLTQGTLNINAAVVSCSLFASNNSNTRALGIAGAFRLTGTGGIWDTSTATNLTVSGSGTVVISDTSATDKVFQAGTLTGLPAIFIDASAGLVQVTLGSCASVDSNGADVEWAGTVTGTFTLTAGTVTPNTSTWGKFSSNNATARELDISNQTLVISGTGTIWDLADPTNFTFTASSSLIRLSNTSSSTKTFNGGGVDYSGSDLTITGSTGSVTFIGTNSFATFTSGATPLVFTDKQTAFVWNLSACTSLTGDIACSTGTVTFNSHGIITDSHATTDGDAVFDANGAEDGGGNSGWINFGSGSTGPGGGMALIGCGS